MSQKKESGIISRIKAKEYLKDLLNYALKLKKYLELDETNKELLIQEIYNNNSLEYFKKFQKDWSKIKDLGPIQTVRIEILSKMIEDKEQKREFTSINTDYIKDLIKKLISEGVFNSNKKTVEHFEKWQSNWKSPSFSRILLFLYDEKYINTNRRKIFELIKFFLVEINLESKEDIKDYFIDENGKFQGKDRLLTNILLKNYKFSIIDFKGSRNQFADRCWFAVYSTYFKRHQDAIQLFLSINAESDGELKIGITPGDDVKKREEYQYDNYYRDIDIVTDNFLDEIINFYQDHLVYFKKFSKLEETYLEYGKIYYWAVAPDPLKDDDNSNPKDSMFERMLINDYYALGWHHFQEDLKNYSINDLKQELKNRGIKQNIISSYIRFKRIKIGDILIARKGDSTNPIHQKHRIYGIGLVLSECNFKPNLDPKGDDNHFRKVTWYVNFYKNKINSKHYLDLKGFIEGKVKLGTPTIVKTDYNSFLQVKRGIENKLKHLESNGKISSQYLNEIIQKVADLESEARRIKDQAYSEAIKSINLIKSEDTQKIDEELKNIYDGINIIEKIEYALLLKKQIILMGPPGTSKSYLAEKIAFKLTKGKKENIELVQFHPSYSYEDFVECNTIINDEHSILKIEPQKKLFRKLCENARNSNENFVLIIDEINRGNVERIFGELIYALENRNKECSTVYFNEPLSIPENIFIIGTMNTVDLSIANIDAALRRRFYIIELMPNEKILDNWLKYHLKDNYVNFQKDLVKFMNELNDKIKEHDLMGKYRTMGHAIFMLKKIKDEANLKEIRENLKMEWNYVIRPTILEYLNFPPKQELSEFDEIFDQLLKKNYSEMPNS